MKLIFNGIEPEKNPVEYGVMLNNKSNIVEFQIINLPNHIDFSQMHCYLKSSDVHTTEANMEKLEFKLINNVITSKWTLTRAYTSRASLLTQLHFYDGNKDIVWQTKIVNFRFLNTIDTRDEIEQSPPGVLQNIHGRLDKIEEQLKNLSICDCENTSSCGCEPIDLSNIQKQLDEISQSINELDIPDLTPINDRLNIMESYIANITNDLTSLKISVYDLEYKLDNLEISDITDIKKQLQILFIMIEDINDIKLPDIKNQVGNLKEMIAAIGDIDLSDIYESINQIYELIEKIEKMDIATLGDRVSSIENDIEAIDEELTEIDSRVTNNEIKIEDLQQQIYDLPTTIESGLKFQYRWQGIAGNTHHFNVTISEDAPVNERAFFRIYARPRSVASNHWVEYLIPMWRMATQAMSTGTETVLYRTGTISNVNLPLNIRRSEENPFTLQFWTSSAGSPNNSNWEITVFQTLKANDEFLDFNLLEQPFFNQSGSVGLPVAVVTSFTNMQTSALRDVISRVDYIDPYLNINTWAFSRNQNFQIILTSVNNSTHSIMFEIVGNSGNGEPYYQKYWYLNNNTSSNSTLDNEHLYLIESSHDEWVSLIINQLSANTRDIVIVDIKEGTPQLGTISLVSRSNNFSATGQFLRSTTSVASLPVSLSQKSAENKLGWHLGALNLGSNNNENLAGIPRRIHQFQVGTGTNPASPANVSVAGIKSSSKIYVNMGIQGRYGIAAQFVLFANAVSSGGGQTIQTIVPSPIGSDGWWDPSTYKISLNLFVLNNTLYTTVNFGGSVAITCEIYLEE